MKKIVAIAAGIIMVFTLSGCYRTPYTPVYQCSPCPVDIPERGQTPRPYPG
jgi:hypothetical protein